MGGFNSLMTFDKNRNSKVVTQYQTTRPLLIDFNEVSDSTTLSAPTAVNDQTITVADPTGFVDGKYIILFNPLNEDFSFMYQVGPPAGNVITVDSQLDRVYPAGAFVDAAITNLAVNGSVTPRTFGLRGIGAPPGVDVRASITRFIFSCITGSPVDLDLFGDLPKLANGLLLRCRNGINTNIFNIKSNREMAGIMFDWMPIAATNPVQGVDGFFARLTLAGDNKLGTALDLPIGDDVEIIVQDDLSGLTELGAVGEGRLEP